MQIFKSVLFLALFLLFVTLLALADHGNAADRSRSQLDGKTDYFPQPYLYDAHQPIAALWRDTAWSTQRYGLNEDTEHNRAIINRFEESGLILGQHDDKNGMKVIEVSDLFLRLADSDKRRIAMAMGHALTTPEAPHPVSFALQHEPSGQFLGLFAGQELQLQ